MDHRFPLKNPNTERTKNNFRSALLSVALLTLATALILSLFFYNRFSSFARSQMLRANQDVTESLCSTIAEKNASVMNFCTTQFSASDVQYLMHAEEPETLEVQRTISHLKRSASSNTNIQAVLTYNAFTGKIFSTQRGITDIDQGILDLIYNQDARQMTPVPRMIYEDDYYISQPVFSYVMRDGYGTDKIDCALIVNVKVEWLTGSLKQLATRGEMLAVFDSDFRQLAVSDRPTADFETAVPEFCREMTGTESNEKIVTVDGVKEYVSVSPIPGTNWYLLRMLPFSSLLREFTSLEQSLLIFSILILIAGIVFSFLIVRKIYRPIKNIAATLQEKEYSPEISENYDDLTYISDALSYVDEQYHSMQRRSSIIVEKNVLRSALAGTDPMPSGADVTVPGSEQIRSLFSRARLVLARYDALPPFTSLTAEERARYEAALTEAAARCPLLRSELPSMTDTSPGDYILFTDRSVSPDVLTETLESIRASLAERHPVSFITESDDSAAADPHTRFNTLLRAARYRFFAGSPCCLDAGEALKKDTLPLNYPSDQALSVFSAVKQNQPDESCRLYAAFSRTLRETNSYDNFRLCITQFFFALQDLAGELSSYSTVSPDIDMDEIYSVINHARDIGEIDGIFSKTLVSMCSAEKETGLRHTVLLSSVRDYIDIHYPDLNLNLKQISADFSISQSYLGKLFREQYGVSVKDYITGVRLSNAAAYLSRTNLSVKKIMEQTGFDSESNFYRLFRLTYGITPSGYRTNHSIDRALARNSGEDGEISENE